MRIASPVLIIIARYVACPSMSLLAYTQLLDESDVALSLLRARSLLVRLIYTLPTPALAASGGPSGLLNITRLLAAQDLAKGIAPSSIVTSDDHSSLPSSDQHDQTNAGPPLDRDSKLISSSRLDGESLLKVIPLPINVAF